MKDFLIECSHCKKEVLASLYSRCPNCSFPIDHQIVYKAVKDLESRLNRKSTLEEIAQELDIEPAEFENIMNTYIDTFTSADFLESKALELRILEEIKNDTINTKEISSDDLLELANKISLCLDKIKGDERVIIEERYLWDTPFDEISKLSGIKEVRVIKLHKKALKKITDHFYKMMTI